MNRIIEVSVVNKAATQTNDTVYICGNSDFFVNFTFDDEWDGHECKTARFIADDKFIDVVFSGNTCPVPIITNTYKIKVGVFVGDLQATKPALISATKSILCGSPSPAAPHPDVYAQMKELFEAGLNTALESAEIAGEYAAEAEEWARKAASGGTGGSGGFGEDGKDGADGVGIESIERTNGDGSPGTTDTYTITLTDGTFYTFTVYNGADGEDGKDGADGVGGGAGGANGKDGITPHIGANGNWFLGDTDTGIKAKGEDGKDGEDGYTPVKGVDYFDGVDGKDGQNGQNGKDGQNGADGITPHIGENKNWFIGDTDTGVKAEGKDGVGGSGGSGDVYSTEETVVGTWIDGKPIYRSFIILGTDYYVSNGATHSVTGVDAESISQIIKGNLIIVSTTDSDCGFSPATIWKSAADTVSFSSTEEWKAKSTRNICLVFDYTKSTDVATLPSATALMDAYDEGVQNA